MADNIFTDAFLDNAIKTGVYSSQSIEMMQIDPEVIAAVSYETAHDYSFIPVSIKGNTLEVITSSDLLYRQKGKIEKEIGYNLSITFTAEDNIQLGLDRYYPFNGTRRAVRDVSASIEDITPLRNSIEQLLQDAAEAKASDIHILPADEKIYVHFRINGHMTDRTDKYRFNPAQHENIVNIIKQKDETQQADQSRKNMPDNGSFTISRGASVIDVRMATVPIGNASGRQKVNLRLLPQDKEMVSIDSLGYLPEDLAAIKNTLFRSANGLFLNSGPTGSGKTTSLYSQMYFVRDSLGEFLNIITIDNPIEIKESTFTQVQVREAQNESISLTAAKILKVGLRSDPDIFLFNEIRDAEDARVALEASSTGHRVFSTVHASDCIRTIARLLDLDIPKTTLLSELKLIISQRLIRRLCPNCSRPHRLTEQEKAVLSPKELEVLSGPGINIREVGTLEAQRGCSCNGGYAGRTAVAEYVIFDMALRDALLNQRSFSEIRNVLKERGFRTMWQKAMRLVAYGETEFKEVLQVIGKE